MERLIRYFTEGVENKPIASSVGMEVETSFVDADGQPISLEQSQKLLISMCNNHRWFAGKIKGQLLTGIFDRNGNRILYELGRQNIELSAVPSKAEDVLNNVKEVLDALYLAGKEFGAFPSFQPILNTDEKLLVIPDERDAIWLELDGRDALELLARTSAVQFTISVPLYQAIVYLNRLGENIGKFLRNYPQEENWRQYIKESKANYHPMRYGGPLFFDSIEDYCRKLIKHDVVIGPNLVPYNQVQDLDIPLYLRSIWWYFRLRRYGNTLCIEIRPLRRAEDNMMLLYRHKIFELLGLNNYAYNNNGYPWKYLPNPNRPESY